MFELTSHKLQLLTPLLTVAGAVDRKQSLAILSNILMRFSDNVLRLTATDLEIEMTASIPCISEQQSGAVTVPGKKMVEIIRSLDDDAHPTFVSKEDSLTIKVGRSQFKLATLPASEYPSSREEANDVEFSMHREVLLQLLHTTHFALSQNDVRFFLNGLLLELDPQMVSVVATDGHRMAIARRQVSHHYQHQRFLIPRKGVIELMRLLNNIDDEMVFVAAGKNHFKLQTNQYTFTTKLIETRFPAYSKVIPKYQDKIIVVDCDLLKRALARIVILANEKLRVVTLKVSDNVLTLVAHNLQMEEAIEEVVAMTQGDGLEISLNAGYLLDVLNNVCGDRVRLSFLDKNTSILIDFPHDDLYQYIIMPMK